MFMTCLKRVLIVAISFVLFALLLLIVGEYELAMMLTKIGGVVGLAVFVVFTANLLIEEWWNEKTS